MYYTLIVVYSTSPNGIFLVGSKDFVLSLRDNGTRIFADLADFRGFYPCELRVVGRGFYLCKLKVVGHGFNGFTRILRIGSWGNISPFSNLRG